MENYRNLYNDLTKELNQLKEELSVAKKEYEAKREKLEDLSVDKIFIEDDLDDLKDEKKYMINSKKEKISNIFGYINTSFLSLTCIAGCAIGAYFMTENISLLKPLIIACSIMTLELIISSITECILKKKIIRKIENSEEYKNIITEIKEKEEELLKLKKLIPNLEKELKNKESRVNILNNKIEEIIGHQNSIKNEVFTKAMGISSDIEENQRPLIKIRTK